MRFLKKSFLLALSLICVLPIIAVYESTDVAVEEGSPKLEKHGRAGRIITRKEVNLTFHENAPATYEIDGVTYTISPENAQVASDVDDVLLQLNKMNLTQAIAKNSYRALPPAYRIGRDWVRAIFTRKKYKSGELVNDIRELARSKSAGGAYAEVLNKFEPGLGNVVHRISAESKRIIPGMTKVVLALTNAGYHVCEATNQSTQEFALTRQRFPELFGLFDDGMTVQYGVRKGEKIIKKPDQEFFEILKTKRFIAVPGTHIIVFFDDKKENVITAAKAGLIAIHFVNPKKLIKDLQALGLPTPSPMNDYNETALERMLK